MNPYMSICHSAIYLSHSFASGYFLQHSLPITMLAANEKETTD